MEPWVPGKSRPLAESEQQGWCVTFSDGTLFELTQGSAEAAPPWALMFVTFGDKKCVTFGDKKLSKPSQLGAKR